jgi:hypothetical protein
MVVLPLDFRVDWESIFTRSLNLGIRKTGPIIIPLSIGGGVFLSERIDTKEMPSTPPFL